MRQPRRPLRRPRQGAARLAAQLRRPHRGTSWDQPGNPLVQRASSPSGARHSEPDSVEGTATTGGDLRRWSTPRDPTEERDRRSWAERISPRVRGAAGQPIGFDVPLSASGARCDAGLSAVGAGTAAVPAVPAVSATRLAVWALMHRACSIRSRSVLTGRGVDVARSSLGAQSAPICQTQCACAWSRCSCCG